MTAIPTNFLTILKDKLEKNFVPHLPELLDKNHAKDEQDKKQLSRAFSAFALHKMRDIGIAVSAKTVVDDFDDNGIDAIYYDSAKKTLFLIQSKFREREQFGENDAIKFRNGVELLLNQKYKRFNSNVQLRKEELDNVFDEADHIQLVIAYIGTGVSAHAKNVLKELTESEDHHESYRLVSKIEEYGPNRVQADLLTEQSVGVVNDSLNLSKWQHLGGHPDTHIGIALISDLVELHNKHQKALYERNIRYFLGTRTSDVNKSIQDTLRMAPDKFFYLNNGITVLVDLIEKPRGTRATRRLQLRGLSVINGAQTISSSAEFVARNPDCDISAAKVLVTIIKADSEGKFGREVTRARNHQNPVSTGNFASLDPRQENLRRELAYLGLSYHYRPEATPPGAEISPITITIEQGMKALALFEADPRYAYWLKNEVIRFQNADSPEYKSLFSDSLSGAQLANKILFFRFVRDVLAANAAATRGAEGLFYKHGIFVIASVFAKICRRLMAGHEVMDATRLNALLSPTLDQYRQLCWEQAELQVGQGRSVLAFFQNQGNTVRLLDKCMAVAFGLDKADEYKAVKGVSQKNENFPLERVFLYLTSKAPQIEEKK
jgi:hypothetical protein